MTICSVADGYIRLWDISHYCVDDDNEVELPCDCEEKYKNFPFIKWKEMLLSGGYWQKLFRRVDPNGSSSTTQWYHCCSCCNWFNVDPSFWTYDGLGLE